MYNQSKEINLDSNNLEDIVFSQDSEHMGGFKNYKSVSNNNENFSDEYMGGYNNKQFGGMLDQEENPEVVQADTVEALIGKAKNVFKKKGVDLICSSISEGDRDTFLKELNKHVLNLIDRNFRDTHFTEDEVKEVKPEPQPSEETTGGDSESSYDSNSEV